MNSLQAKNEIVWAPDPIDGYVKGVIIDLKTDGLAIKCDNNKIVNAEFDQIFPVEEQERDVDDNCSLMHLNSANLLNNCKIRYNRNCIYTNVANILVAINPYTEISKLYNKECMNKYKGKSFGTLPPHIFAIADQSYRNMKIEKVSQSVIVSGESGAGKTETTKYILKYLTECYGAHAGPIEQRINESNPLLEAFGNAKTVRNNNSSRSGKFIEVHFDAKTQITGAYVSHYLLEKSRICRQSANERNYHIFYRMCSGMPQDQRDKLSLSSPDNYNYLKYGTTRYFGNKTDSTSFVANQKSPEFLKFGCLSDIQLNDKTDYQKTINAMKDMGISDEERWDVLSVLAGILHLGNIEFTENDGSQGGCEISKSQAVQQALNQAAKLLGFETNSLADSLCNRYTAEATSRTKMLQIALRKEDAQNARDALSKAIYVRLFDQIVSFVNRSLPFTSSSNFIGILDIAGFEYFERNDFEQFCINYCNEKMQQFFNMRVLKEEQILYDKEGLGLSKIHFNDNQDCIDLIELKGIGIIDILDEESKLPKSSSENFTNSIFKTNSKNFRLELPRKSKLKIYRELRDSEGFTIRHYAGAVCYQTDQFIEKNNDALHDSLKTLLETSKVKLLQTMFNNAEVNNNITGFMQSKRTPATGKLAFVSVASKFRQSLGQLMQKLNDSGSNFIRCIKPNVCMVPNKWEGGVVLSQLKCAGMVTVLDLMQQGFPSRTKFNDLYNIYNSILPKDLARLDAKLFCKLLFKVVGLKSDDYKFGLTKVFFRPGKMAEFDKLIRSDPEHVKVMIGQVKSWLIKYRWRKAQYGVWEVIKLKNKIKWRREKIVIIQKTMRMWLARKKFVPKIRCLIRLRKMENTITKMGQICNQLKSNKSKGQQTMESSKKLLNSTVIKIKTMPFKDQKQLNSLVDSCQKELENGLVSLSKEVDKEKKKEEQERMRKIQEEMEIEKQRVEAEKRRIEEEEMEKKRKADIEKKRKEEEAKNEKIKKKPAPSELKAQKNQVEEYIEDLAKEQERRDRELALRIGEGDLSSVVDDSSSKNNTINNIPASPSKIVCGQNISEMSYDQLRTAINTSTDLKLIDACQSEFHRRINAYNMWKQRQEQKNKRDETTTRNPTIPINDIPASPPVPAPRKSSAMSSSSQSAAVAVTGKFKPQRYFRLPFNLKNSDGTGFWLGHFDGEYIARQIELHDHQTRLLLIAGIDDISMCDLPLSSTGLTKKKGVEITENEFEKIWEKLDGLKLLKNYAKNVSSEYLKEKFLKHL